MLYASKVRGLASNSKYNRKITIAKLETLRKALKVDYEPVFYKTDGKILVPISDDIAGIMEGNVPFPVSEQEFEEKGFSSYKLGTFVKVRTSSEHC